MRLNPDLIRDILLDVEEHSANFEPVVIHDLSIRLIEDKGYTIDEILYHVCQCDLSGFFYRCSFTEPSHETDRPYIDYGCSVIDCLSPKGHEFVENIREKNNWEKVKSVASKVGSFAVKTLIEIAVGVVHAAVTSKLGL